MTIRAMIPSKIRSNFQVNDFVVSRTKNLFKTEQNFSCATDVVTISHDKLPCEKYTHLPGLLAS